MDHPARLYPELMQIYDLAGSAPMPLRSLALRKIASSTSLKDRVWKSELLSESFDAASTAPILWPVDYIAMPEGPAPRLAPRIAQALERNRGLDRLTLQTEAVIAMTTVDRPEARKLFDRIEVPQLPRLSCQDSLIPHVAAYYRLAGQVSGDLGFLEGVVASMRSAEAVQPVTNMLLERKMPDADLEAISLFYSRQLDSLPPANRAFFNELKRSSDTFEKLAGRLEGRPAASIITKVGGLTW